MNSQSRTVKSLKNSVSALLMYSIALAISFVSRSVFINRLGADILGLNTTVSSLLSFLNLTELGIGTAIAVTLYKPLQKGDRESISEIVSVQGWLYRNVACIIIGGSIVLMCFFPMIFAKANLPLWYAYASYAVLLYSSLLGYFFNYKQILLSASQQQYKIQYSYNVVVLLKSVVQIIAVSVLSKPYLGWLILEVVFASLASYVLSRQVNHSFPWIKTDTKKGKALRSNYPEVITKVKQLFVHKIGSFALDKMSPVIIYAYASLSMVTNYGNYMVIVTGVTSVIAAIFNGMNAGVGNLVAEGNEKRTMAVFRELFSSRFVIIAPAAFCIYFFSGCFISFWLGEGFLLNERVVLLIVMLFFIRTSRETVDSFINAYGLFSDIWAPALEAFLNVGCSLLLGYYFGLEGILLGVLISQLVVILCWKPFLLFSKGFRRSIIAYIGLYVKHIVMFALSSIVVVLIIYQFKLNSPSNMLLCICYMGITYVISILLLSMESFICERGFRDFGRRIVRLIRTK